MFALPTTNTKNVCEGGESLCEKNKQRVKNYTLLRELRAPLRLWG